MIPYSIRRFFNRIKRLIDFIPIIWNGFDFDHYYAEELFFHQLKRTSDFLKSDKAYTCDSKMRAQKIDTAIELWKKVSDEEYGCEYQKKVADKYGDDALDINFKETDTISSSGETLYEMNFKYENWDNRDEIEQAKRKWFNESQEKQERAHKLLWDYVEHHIRSWWD